MAAPGARPQDSSLVLGVVCRKSLAHKRMRGAITQPRILLLAGGLEPQQQAQPALGRTSAGGALGSLPGFGGGGGASGASSAAATQSSLSSFDSLLDREQQSLAAAVERIAALQPDVLLVERSVAR